MKRKKNFPIPAHAFIIYYYTTMLTGVERKGKVGFFRTRALSLVHPPPGIFISTPFFSFFIFL
ncbi:hypothetical protein F5X96DRAFT_628451, partial [Biscogniauxia mediterranea]